MKPSIVELLTSRLGSSKVLTGNAVHSRFYHIYETDKPLNAKAVVLPASTQDVSAILKICHELCQPVVVHGGLTNLVGSTETTGDEIVISMEKMDGIEEIDIESRTMTVQAGTILEDVQNAAKEKDLMFPLNYGAKGSAQIGGAISTNAGGLRVLRFGMTRSLILGLETVLADGTIVSSLKKIIKDNSAYDIKHLFIGSEGTLGVVTKAVLKLVERPRSRTSAFVGINEYSNVVAFLKFMDGRLAGTLSGFELIWQDTYVAQTSPSEITPPLPTNYNYYVLLESLGSDPEKDQEKLLQLLEEALEKELILDAVPAYSNSDMDRFWRIREDVDIMISECNNAQHFDISIPIPEIGKYAKSVSEALKKIPQLQKCFIFGHVADGNIHLILSKSEQSDALIHQINEVVYTPLRALGGSVSAEHGIGLHKKRYLEIARNAEEIELMKTLKRTLDPKNILNRGKVIDV